MTKPKFYWEEGKLFVHDPASPTPTEVQAQVRPRVGQTRAFVVGQDADLELPDGSRVALVAGDVISEGSGELPEVVRSDRIGEFFGPPR